MWPQKVAEWTGGTLSTRSETPLTILGFHGVKTQIICIRIRDIVKSKVPMERGVVEKSKLPSASEFQQIRFQESRERVA
jgi:hypothetical protein